MNPEDGKTTAISGALMANMIAAVGSSVGKGVKLTRSFLKEEFGDLQDECQPEGADFGSLPMLSPRIEYKMRLCKDIAQNVGDGHILSSLDEIISQSSAPLYQILFVGRYSTGKSSILNSLLGREILPEGSVPTTKTITWLMPGEEEFLLSEDSKGQILRFPLENLNDTSPENPLNLTEKLFVSLQNPLLQAGVALIDTPGLEDPDAEMTRKTLKAVDAADVVVFVMDCYAGASDGKNLKFLVEKGKTDNLFVVVNKMDLIPKDERKEFFEERLQLLSELGITANVFPFSAREPHLFNGVHGSFPRALAEFMEKDMREARTLSIEKRVDNMLDVVENSCSSLLGLQRQSNSERERIQNRMLTDISALKDQKNILLRKVQRELDNIESAMVINWQQCLRSMQLELSDAIDRANTTQLKRRDFIESRVLGKTFQFLSEEVSRAAGQIESFTRASLEELPLLLPEKTFCIEDRNAKNRSLSTPPPQLLTAGLIVFSWPIMGFFSWIQLTLTAIIGRSLLEEFFGSLTSYLEISRLRKELKDALDKLWPKYDESVRVKIREIRARLQDHVEQVLEKNAAMMTGEAEALASALAVSGNGPSPEKLQEWLEMIRRSREPGSEMI